MPGVPNLFPTYMDPLGGVGGGSTLQLLVEGLIVEVLEMPDVTVEQEVSVEVASSEIDVELDVEIEVEVPC